MIPTSSAWHLKLVLFFILVSFFFFFLRDAYIICIYSQLEDELSALFDFMQKIYGLFGFEFHLELSTRPDNYLGTVETWNQAEDVSATSPSFFFGDRTLIHHLTDSSKSFHNSNSNKHSRSIIQENGT